MNKYKVASDSLTIKTEVVCPNDTNPMGILMGGRLVEWMDIAAAVCSQTHAERICVTASINNVDFNETANVGDIITIYAKMIRVFNTSMEVFVQAFARNVLETKKYLINEAYFTFVAIDSKGNAVPVIDYKPETENEKLQFEEALKRKNSRAGASKIKVHHF